MGHYQGKAELKQKDFGIEPVKGKNEYVATGVPARPRRAQP